MPTMTCTTHRTASRRRRHSAPLRALGVCVIVLLVLLFAPAHAQNNAKNRDLGSEAIVPLKQHSLYSPYVESDLQNKFWDFGGDAIVDTNRAVRLTQDKPSQAGWLWSRLRLQESNFEVSVEFKIDGKAHGSHPYGDGLAIWLTEERAQPGPIFGSKDYFTGLGIMVDTFANARHPYTFPRISAVSLNGVERYHGERDGAGQELAGCSFDVRRAPVATRARLTHVRDVFTSLDIHYKEWDTWENCFKLGNLTLPEAPYLGMSAATGDVSDNHDIVSVTTNSIVYKQRSRKELEAARKYHLGEGDKSGKKAGWFSKSKKKPAGNTGSTASTDSGGHHYNGNAGQGVFARTFKGFFGLLWLLIKLAAIAGVLGAAGYIFYKRKRKIDAKRF